MKRIIQTLVLTAFIAATQSAWSIVRDRHDWMPKPQVESPFPADAEASQVKADWGVNRKPDGSGVVYVGPLDKEHDQD